MKILVSACLLGTPCKYDGGSNRSEAVLALQERHELVPVCPECLGGLPTPRPPAEIIAGCVTETGNKQNEASSSPQHPLPTPYCIRTTRGEDVSTQFLAGAAAALDIAKEAAVDAAVLQPRSPSCGVHEVYDGTFTGTLVPGQGVFATQLASAGIPAFEPDELPRAFS